MKLSELYDIIFDGRYLSLPADDMDRVERCYQFLRSFANDKVIYGINTGFGPMAQWRVDDSHLKELQYNIIRSHATGAGEPLSDIQEKAAMMCVSALSYKLVPASIPQSSIYSKSSWIVAFTLISHSMAASVQAVTSFSSHISLSAW